MGRAEKALLLFLAVCAAGVGFLTWNTRAPAIAVADSSAEVSPRASKSAEFSGSTAAPAGESSAHVTAALVPSARTAPVRDVAAERNHIAGNASGTYLEFMLLHNDSLVARWPERYTTPIRVWIQSTSDLTGWSAQFASVARDAFSVWRSIYVPLRFEFVTDSASAEVVVTWRQSFSGEQVGATKRFRDQHGWLGRAEISLALQTSRGANLDSRYMSAVAVHEVGHALGIDHSPDAADIMAERAGRVFEPTRADLATLALIYAVAPGSIKK